MTKKDEKKLTDQVVALLGEDVKESDYLLITELIDWLRISAKAKEELQDSIRNGDSMPWQTLTSIAMASKQIQNALTKLGITPQQRNRGKKKEGNKGFDLDRFLNDN